MSFNFASVNALSSSVAAADDAASLMKRRDEYAAMIRDLVLKIQNIDKQMNSSSAGMCMPAVADVLVRMANKKNTKSQGGCHKAPPIPAIIIA
jgi:hypothetical protein